MKKILPNSSIKNRTLRDRKDVSPLMKTCVHRWHNESCLSFDKWLCLLDKEEKLMVKEEMNISNDFWNKEFPLNGLVFPSDKLAKAIKTVQKAGLKISNIDIIENL